MKSFFNRVLVVKVDNDLGIVNLSIKVSDTQVEVYKIQINDFVSMIAEFNAQLRK